MKLYKLKKEAVPFFNAKYKTIIKPLETWGKNGIEIQALDEVPPVYLSYGHQREVCGWESSDNGLCHFNFTINIPGCSNIEYYRLKDLSFIRDLMDKITPIIEEHFIPHHESSNHK